MSPTATSASRAADVTDLDPSERGIAMVFQSYALYPHMSVRDNLAFGLKIARTPAAEIERRVNADGASILQIEPAARPPARASCPAASASAWPSAAPSCASRWSSCSTSRCRNLDAELRVSMRVEIARLHRELGNTMIYVTHDQTEAMTLADRIVVLRDGRIEQVGTPRELYEDPNNLFVAGFIGSPRMNIVDAVYQTGGRVSLAGGSLSLGAPIAGAKAGEAIKLGIRPEHLLPGERREQSLQAPCRLRRISRQHPLSLLQPCERREHDGRAARGPRFRSGRRDMAELRRRQSPAVLRRRRAAAMSLAIDDHTAPDARPLVALAMGDPAGISPELAARLVGSPTVAAAARLVLIGDRRILDDGARIAGVALDVEEVGSRQDRRRAQAGA